MDKETLKQAIELVVTTQFASVSMLQRKLKLGYVAAAFLMDRMEALGVVGPAIGTRARDVLYPQERYAEAIALVDGVAADPKPTLTRADKARAVKEMGDRLTIACFHVATSHTRDLPEDPSDRADLLADRKAFAWSMHRKQLALLRIAMARTSD